jgi:hypothetical protein
MLCACTAVEPPARTTLRPIPQHQTLPPESGQAQVPMTPPEMPAEASGAALEAVERNGREGRRRPGEAPPVADPLDGGVVGAVRARSRRARGQFEQPPVIPARRMPLRVEMAPLVPGADPELTRLFMEELAAAMAATQRFEVMGPVPASAVPAAVHAPHGPALEPSNDPFDPEETQAVLTARVIEFIPFQPMRIRAEFALHDPVVGGAPIELQGTWEPPPFPPGPVARPGRWRTERLPVQIAEEEMALIATSPRFFSRFAAGQIAGALTETWAAETLAMEAPLTENGEVMIPEVQPPSIPR